MLGKNSKILEVLNVCSHYTSIVGWFLWGGGAGDDLFLVFHQETG